MPLSRRLRPWEACVSGVSAGSILRVKRVRLAVRLRFWLGTVGRKLAQRFEGPGIRGGLRRESAGQVWCSQFPWLSRGPLVFPWSVCPASRGRERCSYCSTQSLRVETVLSVTRSHRVSGSVFPLHQPYLQWVRQHDSAGGVPCLQVRRLPFGDGSGRDRHRQHQGPCFWRGWNRP